jgi:hypothetical protein
MNLERLRKEMKDKHIEARILVQKFDQSIDHIDDNVHRTVNQLLRSKLIQEINKKSDNILEIALDKHKQLSYDSLREGEEIIIKSVCFKGKNKTVYFFDAAPKSNLQQYGTVDRTILRSYTMQEFRNKRKHLTKSILNGEKDHLLGLKADKILWDVM